MNKIRRVHYVGLALAILGMVMLSVTVVASDKEKNVHPELSEQEMLVACADCHSEATPDVQKEWYDSLHGIAMVKCYQCHGTFGDFTVTPSRQNCGTCHNNMLEKCPSDKPCWECHVPHSFKEKK